MSKFFFSLTASVFTTIVKRWAILAKSGILDVFSMLLYLHGFFLNFL